jgi:hypothetical protein
LALKFCGGPMTRAIAATPARRDVLASFLDIDMVVILDRRPFGGHQTSQTPDWFHDRQGLEQPSRHGMVIDWLTLPLRFAFNPPH